MQKDREERLRQSQVLQPAGFDGESACVIRLDAEGRVIAVNPAALGLFEADSAGELLGRNVAELVASDGHGRFLEGISAARNGQCGGVQDFPAATLRGRRLWVRQHAMPLLEAAAPGQVRAVLAVWYDITEQKDARQPLTRSKPHSRDRGGQWEHCWLAAMVEHAHDAIIGVSVDGLVATWNTAATRLFGMSARNAVGCPLVNCVAGLDFHSRCEIARAVHAEEAAWNIEGHFQRHPDFLIPVSCSVSPVRDKTGQLIGAVILVRDITQQRDAETKVSLAASIFENAAEGIMITDGRNRIISVNRAFETITGYGADEVLGCDPGILFFGSHDQDDHHALWKNVSETGSWRGELWETRKDGTPFCALLSITVVKAAGDGVPQYCTVMMDITGRKEAERHLQTLNAELELRVQVRTEELQIATREMEAFTYSVSHDLRAPLRAIASFSRMLAVSLSSGLKPKDRHCMERINFNVCRMDELITDLLSLSQLSQSPLALQPFDLSALAQTVVEAALQAYPRRSVEVTIHDGMHVNADQKLVRLVLDNLVGNALKFSAKVPLAKVEVGQDVCDGTVVYFVRDNGVGFDMRYSDKLFRPFQRLHSSEDFEGTGIGLSIVQRVVHRHCGRVWLDSTMGAGTKVYFTLGSDVTAIPSHGG